MSDILAELDEVMHQERMEKIFKTYGVLIVAGAIAIILMTAAFSGYKHWNNTVDAAGTNALLTLLDSPDFPDNMKTAELDMRPGLRGIGLITTAGAFLDFGQTEEAIEFYKRAADDTAIPDDLRSLATLMHVRLSEDGDAETLQASLMKIWSNAKSPWRHHARLEAASIAANKQDDFTMAREHLAIIQDAENLPKTLYKTARSLDQIYAIKQTQSAE